MRYVSFLALSILFAACEKKAPGERKSAGEKVIARSIAYHDPEGNWDDLESSIALQMTYADTSIVMNDISFGNGDGFFQIIKDDGTNTKLLRLDGDECSFLLNGKKDYTPDEAEMHLLNCDYTRSNRNYYLYTLGLPMKLTDQGTKIHDQVDTVSAWGGTYLRVKVSYDHEVGKDTWYFYVDPETYRMMVYQFYHDESVNDGEYILLSDEEIAYRNIRMPVEKRWFMNKDDRYLGADKILKFQNLGPGIKEDRNS